MHTMLLRVSKAIYPIKTLPQGICDTDAHSHTHTHTHTHTPSYSHDTRAYRSKRFSDHLPDLESNGCEGMWVRIRSSVIPNVDENDDKNQEEKEEGKGITY